MWQQADYIALPLEKTKDGFTISSNNQTYQSKRDYLDAHGVTKEQAAHNHDDGLGTFEM